jgi:hypothetical protein
VNGALLFGGGMRVGQVIGSTDSTVAYAKDQPIHYQDLLAGTLTRRSYSPESSMPNEK